MGTNLDICVLGSRSNGNATALARRGLDTAIATIQFDTRFERLTAFRDRLEKAAAGDPSRPRPDELSQFGLDLFDFVVGGDLRRLYDRLPSTHVRIQILSNMPELQSLPWEFIQEPNKPRGRPDLTRTVVRVVPTVGLDSFDPARKRKTLRVLFAYSDPVDLERVSWEQLKRSIERKLSGREGVQYTLNVIPGTSRTKLSRALASGPYDIFHFFGHGTVRDGRGQLVFTNPRSDKSQYVDAESLAAMLSGRDIRLAILSACETSTGRFEDGYSVTAEALVRAGIPAVVANQFSIPLSTITPFVEGLYGALLRTGDIDLAFSEGRSSLAFILEGHFEWGIPTLYRRSGSSQLMRV
jgi:hypothetical protein